MGSVGMFGQSGPACAPCTTVGAARAATTTRAATDRQPWLFPNRIDIPPISCDDIHLSSLLANCKHLLCQAHVRRMTTPPVVDREGHPSLAVRVTGLVSRPSEPLVTSVDGCLPQVLANRRVRDSRWRPGRSAGLKRKPSQGQPEPARRGEGRPHRCPPPSGADVGSWIARTSGWAFRLFVLPPPRTQHSSALSA